MDQTAAPDMIRHVVLFSAKTPENVGPIVEGLSMLAQIPMARNFQVTRNRQADSYSNEIDVVVYAEFEDADALAAYRAHPIYQKCIEVVRPLRDLRFAADF